MKMMQKNHDGATRRNLGFPKLYKICMTMYDELDS
jgi:hypothetical protein